MEHQSKGSTHVIDVLTFLGEGGLIDIPLVKQVIRCDSKKSKEIPEEENSIL